MLFQGLQKLKLWQLSFWASEKCSHIRNSDQNLQNHLNPTRNQRSQLLSLTEVGLF